MHRPVHIAGAARRRRGCGRRRRWLLCQRPACRDTWAIKQERSHRCCCRAQGGQGYARQQRPRPHCTTVSGRSVGLAGVPRHCRSNNHVKIEAADWGTNRWRRPQRYRCPPVAAGRPPSRFMNVNRHKNSTAHASGAEAHLKQHGRLGAQGLEQRHACIDCSPPSLSCRLPPPSLPPQFLSLHPVPCWRPAPAAPLTSHWHS